MPATHHPSGHTAELRVPHLGCGGTVTFHLDRERSARTGDEPLVLRSTCPDCRAAIEGRYSSAGLVVGGGSAPVVDVRRDEQAAGGDGGGVMPLAPGDVDLPKRASVVPIDWLGGEWRDSTKPEPATEEVAFVEAARRPTSRHLRSKVVITVIVVIAVVASWSSWRWLAGGPDPQPSHVGEDAGDYPEVVVPRAGQRAE